jgi:hypothetical protein
MECELAAIDGYMGGEKQSVKVQLQRGDGGMRGS